MFASYDSFAHMIRNPTKISVIDDVLTLVNIEGIPGILTTSGFTDIDVNWDQGEVTTVYIDGDAHFRVGISSNNDFFCAAENNFCPDVEAIPEAVHEVASANSEGLVLRLRSGALYYKHDDEWVVDTEAIQAGTLKGSLFRLLRNGTILRDGEVIGEGKHSLLVTDYEVFADGEAIFELNNDGEIEPVIPRAAGPATESSILIKDTLEYRFPLLVQRQTT